MEQLFQPNPKLLQIGWMDGWMEKQTTAVNLPLLLYPCQVRGNFGRQQRFSPLNHSMGRPIRKQADLSKLKISKGIRKNDSRSKNDALYMLKEDLEQSINELASLPLNPDKVHHPILDRRIHSYKNKKAALQKERQNVKLVLENSHFQEDPFAAIKNHLENLVKSAQK